MGRKQIAENTGRNYVKCLNDLNSKTVEYKMRKQILVCLAVGLVMFSQEGSPDRKIELLKLEKAL